MPRVILPQKSPAHRFACRTLYRALLRQTSKLPVTIHSTETQEAIEGHIKRRFHRDAKYKSSTQITNSLLAGYEGLELLINSTSGSHDATKRIKLLLKQYEAKKSLQKTVREALEKARDTKKLRPRKVPKIPRDAPLSRREAESPSKVPRNILDPPVPMSEMEHPPSNGRRRTPYLVSANGIPFLRYHKTMPRALAGLIREKLKNEQIRLNHREKLAGLIDLGREEDNWDALVNRSNATRDGKWADVPETVDNEIMTKSSKIHRDKIERGIRMFEVYVREKELALEEETDPLRRMELKHPGDWRQRKALQKAEWEAAKNAKPEEQDGIKPLEKDGDTEEKNATDPSPLEKLVTFEQALKDHTAAKESNAKQKTKSPLTNEDSKPKQTKKKAVTESKKPERNKRLAQSNDKAHNQNASKTEKTKTRMIKPRKATVSSAIEEASAAPVSSTTST